MRRNPLLKEKFLEGNRQKWALTLIVCAAGVLVSNMKYEHMQPEPYLTFLTMIGCVFLAGMSLDAYAKIRAYPTPPTPPLSEEMESLPFEEEEFTPPKG